MEYSDYIIRQYSAEGISSQQRAEIRKQLNERQERRVRDCIDKVDRNRKNGNP